MNEFEDHIQKQNKKKERESKEIITYKSHLK